MSNELTRLENIIDEMHKAKENSLVFDPNDQTLRIKPVNAGDDEMLKLKTDDMKYGCGGDGTPIELVIGDFHADGGGLSSSPFAHLLEESRLKKIIVIVSQAHIDEVVSSNYVLPGYVDFYQSVFNNGDRTFSCIPSPQGSRVLGCMYLASENYKVDLANLDQSIKVACEYDSISRVYSGFVRNSDQLWLKAKVIIFPKKSELYSRYKGVLESSALENKIVAIVGLGSNGSSLATELAQSGVQHFILFDFDPIEPGNVCRHRAGQIHVGRDKPEVVKDLVHEINPYARVEAIHLKVESETLPTVYELIKKADLVYAAPDDHQARLLINYACVKLQLNCIFVGFGTRAVNGLILRYVPGQSLCFQCFMKKVPSLGKDVRVANKAHSDRVSYSDKVVPVEPGLSTDIAPISTMGVKLGIQLLLEGQETTLRSLDEDLTAPLYLWINRREGRFDHLEPLGASLNNMRILRWYGIDIQPDPECPICGNFVGDADVD